MQGLIRAVRRCGTSTLLVASLALATPGRAAAEPFYGADGKAVVNATDGREMATELLALAKRCRTEKDVACKNHLVLFTSLVFASQITPSKLPSKPGTEQQKGAHTKERLRSISVDEAAELKNDEQNEKSEKSKEWMDEAVSTLRDVVAEKAGQWSTLVSGLFKALDILVGDLGKDVSLTENDYLRIDNMSTAQVKIEMLRQNELVASLRQMEGRVPPGIANQVGRTTRAAVAYRDALQQEMDYRTRQMDAIRARIVSRIRAQKEERLAREREATAATEAANEAEMRRLRQLSQANQGRADLSDSRADRLDSRGEQERPERPSPPDRIIPLRAGEGERPDREPPERGPSIGLH